MKPIKVDESIVNGLVEQFRRYLTDARLTSGEVNFKGSLRDVVGGDRAKIVFSPVAYAKMVALLQDFDVEVAWHGAAERREDGTYYISDIIVYPQAITATTVDMDEEEYAKWLIKIDSDERFSFGKIRMQGHSHVRMGTTPSGTDLDHQKKILDQLRDNGFYIFMIYNKSLEHYACIYDLDKNTMYENGDIDVIIDGEKDDIRAFVAEAHTLARSSTTPRTYKTTTQTTWPPTTYYNKPAKTKKKDGYAGSVCEGCKSLDCFHCDLWDDSFSGGGYTYFSK